MTTLIERFILKRHKDKLLQELKKVWKKRESAVTQTPIFSKHERLWGRVVYFNHDKQDIKDIHNMAKPLLDFLQQKVYHDDKQIRFFKGARLDMKYNKIWFELELDGSIHDLENAMEETVFLIEIGKLLPHAESTAIKKLKWLQQ